MKSDRRLSVREDRLPTPSLLLSLPLLGLLAVGPTGSHVYEVTHYGAKCDAVTTDGFRTALVAPAPAAASVVRVAAARNIVAGAQLYLEPESPDQEVRLVRGVTGDAVALDAPLKFAHARDAQVYGSGGYVSGADDTRPINAAFAAAAHDPDATVQFPGPGGRVTGKCAVSGPLHADASGLTVAGAGMHATTIVAMPSFDYDPATTPRGLDGQYVGMLWTDLPEAPPPGHRLSPPQPPLQHVTIRDLGLDPRAGTQTHFYKYQSISGDVRAMQDFTVRNVFFELGAPLSSKDLTKPFTGINYIALSYDPANASHDLHFSNIETHNGVGSIQLRQGAGASQTPCPPVVHDRIDGITIENTKDVVDEQSIQDDRIVISASGCRPGAEIDHVDVSGQTVSVAPSVRLGAANALKIEAANAVMRDVRFTGLSYTGSPNGSYLPSGSRWATGYAFAALIFNTNSGIDDVSVTHLRAVSSEGVALALRGGPGGEPVHVTLDDLTITDGLGSACVRLGSLAAPTGRDQVRLSRITCSAAPQARERFGDALYGILLAPTGGVPGNGVSGDVEIRDSRLTGFPKPLGIAGSGGFRGVVVDGVTWDSGRPQIDRSTIMRNVPHD
ncbi:MAG TPA: hypothetical protein VFB22_16470 [Candidatus Baltobacteraceae bacterium]|nr:hypothetical protein [Candidatus Baltobacteraceae bacterium]